MDQDSAFISSLMNYLFKKLDIKIKTVAPYNHQPLQAEHRIKSLLTILMIITHSIPTIWNIIALMNWYLVESQNYSYIYKQFLILKFWIHLMIIITD